MPRAWARGFGFRACQYQSVASQNGCSICSKTYNFAFFFNARRSAEGAHQSSSLLRYIKSADEHNGMLSNVLFGRGSDKSNACRATSHSGGVWKYCVSNVLFGRGSNHFNALFERGFGEYVVTLVKLRNGCMRQAYSAPDTSFVSLPAGGRNLQPTLSVDNAFEGKRQPSPRR